MGLVDKQQIRCRFGGLFGMVCAVLNHLFLSLNPLQKVIVLNGALVESMVNLNLP
jgi:hypothetical protein